MLRVEGKILPTLSDADYVHDIAYDFYGTRLALCTSSLRISIYSAPSTGTTEAADGARWTETARIERAHTGPIWRLSWGHPEGGEPLASCSEDRTIAVWCDRRRAGGADGGATRGDGSHALPSWPRCAQLNLDGPTVDVRFAPAAFGLKLAACAEDGKARIFECTNPLDLSSWEPEDLEAASRSSVIAAAPSSSAALDWIPAPFGGSASDDREILAVAGRGSQLVIWGKGKTNRWQELGKYENVGAVKDLAWCPNLCRSYEIIATCGDGAKLWQIDFNSQDDRGYNRNAANPGCKIDILKELVPPGMDICPVWRCSWNLTGTTLALCPEGTEVSVWKVNPSLEWVQQCDVEMAGSS